MDDHCNPAVTNASIAAREQKGSHRRNSDQKPLPDLIPKSRKSSQEDPENRNRHRYRSDSDSPAPIRKKSNETGPRKQSNDGDVSRTSDTDPSDRDGPGIYYLTLL